MGLLILTSPILPPRRHHTSQPESELVGNGKAGAPTALRILSERELEIVACIAKGRTNQEIAAELFISLSTVKTHITRIQEKLDVRNRVEIAAWSWETGIPDPHRESGYLPPGTKIRAGRSEDVDPV